MRENRLRAPDCISILHRDSKCTTTCIDVAPFLRQLRALLYTCALMHSIVPRHIIALSHF